MACFRLRVLRLFVVFVFSTFFLVVFFKKGAYTTQPMDGRTRIREQFASPRLTVLTYLWSHGNPAFGFEMTQETNGATGHVMIFFLWIKGMLFFWVDALLDASFRALENAFSYQEPNNSGSLLRQERRIDLSTFWCSYRRRKGACEQPKQMHESYGYYEDVDVTAPQLLSKDG